MATVDFPAGILPDSEDWTLTFNTQTFVSDLNGATQTQELPGARWSVSMTFGNRSGASARRLRSFVRSLRGRAGRFYVTPADAEPLGNPSGTGVVSVTGSAGATQLSTNGWDLNVTNLFRAGDYFEVNGEFKEMTADIDSDGSGNATLIFTPPLRKEATSSLQIRYTNPRCVMMLSADDARVQTTSPVIYSLTIEGMEALDV